MRPIQIANHKYVGEDRMHSVCDPELSGHISRISFRLATIQLLEKGSEKRKQQTSDKELRANDPQSVRC